MDFEQQIIRNPEDDLPRLAYASYLSGRGDPRGEFIALQCEMVKAGDERRLLLDERCTRLEETHGHSWNPLKSKPPNLVLYGYRRGFIEFMRSSSAEFLKYAEKMFNEAPIWAVELVQASDAAEEISRCPYLDRLKYLALTSRKSSPFSVRAAKPDLDAQALRTILESPYLKSLQWLVIDTQELGDEVAKIVASVEISRRFNALTLRRCRIGNRGAFYLAQSERLSQLCMLDLSNNLIDDSGARCLAGSPHLQNLKRLRLGYTLGGECCIEENKFNPISETSQELLKSRFGVDVCVFGHSVSLGLELSRKDPLDYWRELRC